MQKVFIAISLCLLISTAKAQEKIDRKAVVTRHNVNITKIDTLGSLSVGNGTFAFTVDATGLQTFPDYYQAGVPLGTQSEWGWDAVPNTENYKFEETLRDYDQNGRQIPYSVQQKTPEHAKNAVEYFRANAHRLQLGNLGFELYKKDGSLAKPSDIKNIKQILNVWTGEIESSFTLEGTAVKVWTASHQEKDVIGVKVASELMKTGQLKIRVRIPFPTMKWGDNGNLWKSDFKYTSTLSNNGKNEAIINHKMDSISYKIGLKWKGTATIAQKEAHYYLLTPSKNNQFEFSCEFAPAQKGKLSIPDVSAVQSSSTSGWGKFWKSGGAVDFSQCTDARAFELERRVVLSQYLTKLQCTGTEPPQETGLTYNSWYGKPHLEMHWWHGVHFPLWGRAGLLEKSLPWYNKVYDNAKKIAERQGFDGVRWQKMTDPDGNEAPSSIGALLIWQQPHFITYAELMYRNHKYKATLELYKKRVFATADFMASFAYYDQAKKRYILGPGVIPAQERFKASETFNPTYELAYWNWALNTALEWKKRLGEPEVAKWKDVVTQLSKLPVQDNVYLATESATDSYTNPEYKTDHPSVFGTFGMLPETTLLDKKIMKNTFDLIWKTWSWNETWGWDFPMTAMTAARLGMPDKAIDALFMDVQKNTYLINGHNYQEGRLPIYLPGNGGLLTAVAMMCAGWDGTNEKNPGFPKDGTWKVRWEGLEKMF
jgi:protein-glucosylgalactosylhydroxylysine glucosidase